MTGARKIADERSWHNRHHPQHRGVLNDPQRIDADGALGELAFASLFRIPERKIERSAPTSANFILADGTRVDVRASRAREARLIVPPRVADRNTIDVFVLAQIAEQGYGKEPTVTLRGWATRDEVRAAPIQAISPRKGAPPVHVINTWHLHDMDALLARHQPRTLPLL